MKIPESVRIGGVEYTVNYVDHLAHDATLAYGHISWDDSVIELSGTVGTSHQKRCMTLWHEIIHGIVEHANMDIANSNEEAIVDTIAKGVYQVLQDNGARFFDLKDGKYIIPDGILTDMRTVKRTISDVEIILGKKDGETTLVNDLINAQNLLTYCMSRLDGEQS